MWGKEAFLPEPQSYLAPKLSIQTSSQPEVTKMETSTSALHEHEEDKFGLGIWEL